MKNIHSNIVLHEITVHNSTIIISNNNDSYEIELHEQVILYLPIEQTLLLHDYISKQRDKYWQAAAAHICMEPLHNNTPSHSNTVAVIVIICGL